MCDIYDGNIWKTFKDIPSEDLFFRPENANLHLGLILNLDWFQPYNNIIYSTGILYAAIANFPHNIQFKRENILILGILPGPNEASLHKINNYLYPIVVELELLWQGITLSSITESPEKEKIQTALILISCDTPAAWKICSHVSALISCYCCKKKVNYNNNQHNFGGMQDMNKWFFPKDSATYRQKALEWRYCNSDAARKQFVKDNDVRWSELLRLPYFDPVQYVIVDLMYCLFLGIAKWIIKRI